MKKLKKEDQLNLLQKLMLLLKKEEKAHNNPVSLTSLAGLGSETWKNTDIDKYIEGERQW